MAGRSFEMATVQGYQEFPCHHIGPLCAHRDKLPNGSEWRLSVSAVGMAIPYCNYDSLEAAKASAEAINKAVDLSGVHRSSVIGSPSGWTNAVKKALGDEIERQGLKPRSAA